MLRKASIPVISFAAALQAMQAASNNTTQIRNTNVRASRGIFQAGVAPFFASSEFATVGRNSAHLKQSRFHLRHNMQRTPRRRH
jgi:hypothetical protein